MSAFMPVKHQYHVLYKNNKYLKHKGRWLIWGNMSLFPERTASVIANLEKIYKGEPHVYGERTNRKAN